jgi:hypothetical protein
VTVELVPVKLVSVVQRVRFGETSLRPFNPWDNYRLKLKLLAVAGGLVNASCSAKVLLDTTLKELVAEKSPPRDPPRRPSAC